MKVALVQKVSCQGYFLKLVMNTSIYDKSHRLNLEPLRLDSHEKNNSWAFAILAIFRKLDGPGEQAFMVDQL